MPQALAPQTAKDYARDYLTYSPLNSFYGRALAHSIINAARNKGIEPLTLFLAFTADKMVRSHKDEDLAAFASLCRGNKISYGRAELELLVLDLKKNLNIIGASGDPVLLYLLRTDKHNALASLQGEFSKWRGAYSKNEYQKDNLARLDSLNSFINGVFCGSIEIKENNLGGVQLERHPLPKWKVTHP